jgi:UDPglucose 6-dehydrogenase
LGYGGSCFPKDVKALIRVAEDNGFRARILESADSVNQDQRTIFLDKILTYYNNNVEGRTFALWGLAFKPRTNDMREAPAVNIINKLLNSGAKIQAYDPKACDEAKKIFGDKIKYVQNNYDALENADGLIIVTEWNEFRRPDYDKMKKLLKYPVIFDGRNQYDPKRLLERGFDYFCVGKNYCIFTCKNTEAIPKT